MSHLLSFLLDGKPAGEVVLRPSVPKNLALLCLDTKCEAIFEAGGGGPGEPNTCPRCGGREVGPIARWLDRESKPEVTSDATATT